MVQAKTVEAKTVEAKTVKAELEQPICSSVGWALAHQPWFYIKGLSA
ncbi:hypothetical protein Shal_3457 [Shewanella halifaxensis HAW-EB4]|uniref:Uncharacterized protein n=1 Tax=Shewanella halifaxensis (strain HAW-EB4) TaxID=458817 RepID=B0TT62_SHEHH|nr:hypothetical protein [Shewanella halifaxensis]ABZ78003.1 hypothetical protein Shal_3457 [Shewanella halifaxensis HAW-EB4]